MTAQRAAIYLRISNDPTGQEAGVTRQREDCTALAASLGVEVVTVYEDNDISAYSGTRRPGYEALLDAMKNHQFDVLLCWHTDRLYRSLKDLERLIDIAESRAVVIRTVNGGDLDLSTATGKMLARILGSVARAESEHKAERQRRANEQRAGAGEWWSARRCFGYTRGGEIEVAEAAMVREAATDVLAGVSLRQIARRWNDQGITSVRGATWNVSRLKRMLINPRYAAIRSYNGREAAPGTWPAILDADTHRGLVAVLRDPTRGAAVSYERRYIGSHRYICGVEGCGAKMHHHISTHKGGKSLSRYACTASSHLSRTQTELDAYVEQVALEYLRRADGLAQTLRDGDNAVDVGELRTRRTALQARLDDLAALFAEGAVDASQLRRGTAELRAKLAEIDTTLAELARRSPLAAITADGIEDIESRWEAATPDMKGKIIDELFTVVVMPAPRGRYFKREYIEFRKPGGVSEAEA